MPTSAPRRRNSYCPQAAPARHRAARAELAAAIPCLSPTRIANPFELPVLFYVLVILACVTRKADLLFVILSWLFVLSRIAQAYVHVTSNRVSRRGLCSSCIGALVLTIMWIIFMVRILLAL